MTSTRFSITTMLLFTHPIGLISRRCISQRRRLLFCQNLELQSRYIGSESGSGIGGGGFVRRIDGPGYGGVVDRFLNRRRYRIDRMNVQEWLLIYDERMFIRLAPFISICLTIIAIWIGAMFGYEYWTGEEVDKMKQIRQELLYVSDRLRGLLHIFQLAPAHISYTIFILANICLFAIFLRVRRLLLLRIYQNRAEPKHFIAIAPRLLYGKNRINFQVGTAHCDEDQPRKWILMLNGNMSINGRRLYFDDRSFCCTNNYRNFMFGQCSSVPNTNI